MTSSTRGTLLTIRRLELPTPFPVGPVNAYLIKDANQAVLIDCGPGTKAARDVLIRGLSEEGLVPEDLTAVVLTHGHVDHVGQAAWLQSLGVTVCAPPEVETWLQPGSRWDSYRQEFFTTLYTMQGVPEDVIHHANKDLGMLQKLNTKATVDVTLSYNQTCPVLPMFQVLHVPGHAQHALALWNAETGEIIVGDQLLPEISSNALVEPELTAKTGSEAKRTLSLMQYRENLRSLLELEISVVYPGHGPVFEDAHTLIRSRLAAQEKRRQQFYERVVESGGTSAYQLATSYFARHKNQTSLIMSETLGYLDWLSAIGEIDEVNLASGQIEWKQRRG
ncbi:MBL fold metallo-hydrolase [Alicyclobacillus ferrooxydans]|uniref:Metallo-beta-lactamase domain-containing protein n=1 Tax=Alicyclobacillus ferrooxydans TaxID=471514 RepID=A0A0P9CKG2_9BACL|nr:MBL fold metallo-hydrolase [Alicyclobacillus ferrooxydans]KPV43502.1 hypothetical protein AN477_11845 [Alicyclobacillus ferrooxydans]